MLSQRIRKRYDKTYGTSVINSPMSPPSLYDITPGHLHDHFHKLLQICEKKCAQIYINNAQTNIEGRVKYFARGI